MAATLPSSRREAFTQWWQLRSRSERILLAAAAATAALALAWLVVWQPLARDTDRLARQIESDRATLADARRRATRSPGLLAPPRVSSLRTRVRARSSTCTAELKTVATRSSASTTSASGDLQTRAASTRYRLLDALRAMQTARGWSSSRRHASSRVGSRRRHAGALRLTLRRARHYRRRSLAGDHAADHRTGGAARRAHQRGVRWPRAARECRRDAVARLGRAGSVAGGHAPAAFLATRCVAAAARRNPGDDRPRRGRSPERNRRVRARSPRCARPRRVAPGAERLARRRPENSARVRRQPRAARRATRTATRRPRRAVEREWRDGSVRGSSATRPFPSAT